MSSSHAGPALERKASRKGKEKEIAHDLYDGHGGRPGAAETGDQVEYFKTQLRDLLRARNAEKEKYSARTQELEQTIKDAQQSLRAAQTSLSKRDAEVAALREDLLVRRAAPVRTSADEDSIRELERELRRLRGDIARLDKEKLGWEKERVGLSDAVRAERNRAATALEEAKAIRSTKDRAAERKAQEEREAIRMESERWRKETEDAKEWLRLAAIRCGKLEEEKADLVRTCHEALIIGSTSVRDVQAEVEQLRSERDAFQLEVAMLEERHEQLRIDYAQISKDNSARAQIGQDLLQDLEAHVKVHNISATADQAAAAVAVRATRQALLCTAADVKLLKQQRDIESVVDKDRATVLQSQALLAEAEKAELAVEVAASRAGLKDLTADLAQARTQLSTLQGNYAELSDSHALKINQLAAASQELTSVREEMHRERVKFDERRDVLKRLGGDLGMLGTGYDALERECEELRVALIDHQETQAALETLRLDHRIVQDKLAQYQYEAHTLGDLNASLSGVQPAFGDRVAYIQGLRVELSYTKEALIATRAHLAASRSKIAALTKELEIYRAQEVPLHIKPVAKRITVARVRDPLGNSLNGNTVGRQ